MLVVKSILMGAVLLVGATLVAQAQLQYPTYPYYQAFATPPYWSYDPYTSGLAPCPQWLPGDSTPCRKQMPPTYGQPDYRPHRP